MCEYASLLTHSMRLNMTPFVTKPQKKMLSAIFRWKVVETKQMSLTKYLQERWDTNLGRDGEAGVGVTEWLPQPGPWVGAHKSSDSAKGHDSMHMFTSLKMLIVIKVQ